MTAKDVQADAPHGDSPGELRRELRTKVEQVVAQGQHAIANTEIQLALIEHKVVSARSMLETLRQSIDELQTSGERIGGRLGE